MEAVVAALISAAAAIVVGVIEHRKSLSVIDFRLKALEDKVDKHNRLIERTYELEKQSEVFRREFKTVGHRLSDLEKKECQMSSKNI